jgi:hypothetical protein
MLRFAEFPNFIFEVASFHSTSPSREDRLVFMGIHATSYGPAADKLAGRALDLTWHLLANRAWSLACRHGAPAESYAHLLTTNHAQQARTMDNLKRSFCTTSPVCVLCHLEVVLFLGGGGLNRQRSSSPDLTLPCSPDKMSENAASNRRGEHHSLASC